MFGKLIIFFVWEEVLTRVISLVSFIHVHFVIIVVIIAIIQRRKEIRWPIALVIVELIVEILKLIGLPRRVSSGILM